MFTEVSKTQGNIEGTWKATQSIVFTAMLLYSSSSLLIAAQPDKAYLCI